MNDCTTLRSGSVTRMHALFAAAALCLASAKGEPVQAVVVSPLQKIRPGSPFEGANRASLLAARGECEGTQVRLKDGLGKVTSAPLTLQGPKSHLAARLYREAYLSVQKPSNSDGATGLWPDPLIPVEDAFVHEARHALPAASTSEQPLVLYAEFCIPKDQAPGTYQGNWELSNNGTGLQKIPVSVEVVDVQIPATSSLPNSFGISIYSLAKGHKLDAASPDARALLHNYASSALQHRFSLHGMGMDPLPFRWEGGRAQVDFSAYEEELGPFLSGTALPSGARFSTAEVRDQPKLSLSDRVAYYRSIRDHFKEKKWNAQLFFYAKDEPTPKDVPIVLSQAEAVHQAGQIPVLVTSPLNPQLLPAADILAPAINCFFPRTGLPTCTNIQTAQALRDQLGTRRLWWYQSCLAHGCDHPPKPQRQIDEAFSGWASYMVDHSAARNRSMGPLAYLNRVDGELYYATVLAYHLRDPWTGLFDFGGNGDGTLFYPGTPEKIGGKHHIPIESLRLKSIRDGLEDYELFLLAEKRLGEEQVRSRVRKVIRSGYDIDAQTTAWESLRQGLLTQLATAPSHHNNESHTPLK